MKSDIMRFFQYEHLPPKLKGMSMHFYDLAAMIDKTTATSPAEKATALRKLLESKDAAVRAIL